MAENFKILVAEDDEDVLYLYESGLTAYGDIETTLCEDGEEALAKAKCERFDAIVTDLRMPNMDGLELVAAVREGTPNMFTPVYIVSGNVTDEALLAASELNVAQSISKPVELERLMDMLRESFSSRRSLGGYDSAILIRVIDSSRQTFQHYLTATLMVGRASIKNSDRPYISEWLVSIGFEAESSSGVLVLDPQSAFVDHLRSTLKTTRNIGDRDIMAEMANQIVGRLKIAFSEMKFKVQIGLPQIIEISEGEVSHIADAPCIAFSIGSGSGFCHLEFSMSCSEGEWPDDNHEADSKCGEILVFD